MKYVIASVAVSVLAAAASATTIWDEAVQGDLSGDRLTPNTFALSAGPNDIRGVLSGFDDQGNLDRDFFTIVVPSGFQLTRLDLLAYDSPDFAAFIAIQPGTIFFPDPNDAGPSDLLGWTLFGPFDVGTNILPDIAANGQTFSTPLPAGSYTFWAQQTGDSTTYTGSFVVELIPTPGVATLGALAALALGRRRRVS